MLGRRWNGCERRDTCFSDAWCNHAQEKRNLCNHVLALYPPIDLQQQYPFEALIQGTRAVPAHLVSDRGGEPCQSHNLPQLPYALVPSLIMHSL